MKGVSEVIAIILILMITIAIAGLAYTFMSSTMASTTSAASSAVDTTTTSMLTSFTIESMDVAKVYVRNTGQNALSSLSVYVNDEPATFSITPTTIAPGQIGAVTIFSFIPNGGTIKMTTPSGFSASKVSTPCSKAAGCWEFGSGSGTTSYDSSAYANTGTLVNAVNGTVTWASGKYGSAVSFSPTGVSATGYVKVNHNPNLNLDEHSIDIVFKLVQLNAHQNLLSKHQPTYLNYFSRINNDNRVTYTIYGLNGTWANVYSNRAFVSADIGMWHHLVMIYNGSYMFIYIDDILDKVVYTTGTPSKSTDDLYIGAILAGNGWALNGTIDEMRIYNRAIY